MDEFVGEGEMERFGNAEGEVVKWCKKTKKLGEPRADSDGEDGVPDKETADSGFGDGAFLPGDFGMEDISDDGSCGGGDEGGEPEIVVIINNKIC